VGFYQNARAANIQNPSVYEYNNHLHHFIIIMGIYTMSSQMIVRSISSAGKLIRGISGYNLHVL